MNTSLKDSTSKIVLNYVNSKDELAFQLNGPWGSGKTYYVEHKVIPEIQNHGKVPVYFSLNGLKDIEVVKKSLNSKILLSFAEDKGDKYNVTGKVDKLLEVAGNTDLGNSVVNTIMKSVVSPVKDQLKKSVLDKIDFANFVLVIDDLERIVEPLKTKEVFGYIATLQEQWHCKIIIVSNEEQSHDADDIALIKEKVINKKLEFSEDVFEIANQIIALELGPIVKNQKLREWEKSVARDMLRMLVRSDKINLRTIKSIVSSYSEFESYLTNQEVLKGYEKEQMEKTGFLSIFVLTDCAKRGFTGNNADVENIWDTSHMSLQASQTFQRVLDGIKKTDAEQEDEEEKLSNRILRVFHGKVDEFDDNIAYTLQILNLVNPDSFDFSKYYSEIQSVFFPYIPIKKARMDKLANFRDLTDEELYKIQLDVKQNLSLEKEDFQYLLRVFRMMRYFEKNDLLLIDWNIEEIYLELLSRISKTTKKNFRAYKFSFMRGEGDPTDEQENALRQAYEARGKDLAQDADKTMVEDILSNNWYERSRNESTFEKRSLFKMLLDEKTIDNIFLQVNHSSEIKSLKSYIYNEISSISNASVYHSHELEYAKTFFKELKAKGSLVPNKVQQFNFKELETEVEHAIDRLS